jgi:hypothetical protein
MEYGENAFPSVDHARQEKIVKVCRTNVEALHNLQFLMFAHVTEPDHLSEYLEIMNEHLQKMTDVLCRKTLTNSMTPNDEDKIPVRSMEAR